MATGRGGTRQPRRRTISRGAPPRHPATSDGIGQPTPTAAVNRKQDVITSAGDKRGPSRYTRLRLADDETVVKRGGSPFTVIADLVHKGLKYEALALSFPLLARPLENGRAGAAAQVSAGGFERGGRERLLALLLRYLELG